MGSDHGLAALAPTPAAPLRATERDPRLDPRAPTRRVVVPRSGVTAWRRLRANRAIAFLLRHRANLIVTLVAGAIDALAYLAPDEGMEPRRVPLGIVLALAAAAILPARRRHPMRVLAGVVVIQMCLVVLTTATTHSFGGALLVALYTVARFGSTRDLWIAGVGAFSVQVLRDAYDSETFVQMVGADLLATLLVVGVGLGTAKWQGQVELNRRLLADRAVTEERRRIARELHDIVAHHITTMYLMSGGARATLDRDPDTAREALFTLESSGRSALREMRQLLGVLRSDDGPEQAPSEPQPGMDDIDGLIIESRAAGLPVEYRELGEREPLPPATGLTLYRIVQEALTNTRKHAGNARTCVEVRHLPDRVLIEVLDDGAGNIPATGVVGGYGLTGMRERVALHGGTLEVGPCPGGGFRVFASVPLPPKAPTGAAERV
ncbi:sensor histidine kinase [Embleya hyalina]|uniref:histidine kinase n=1 Tax=Embleya hyalina TaxID=516124 RepID=A0A401Z6M2_9ACTN|nr:sensor histidine kinase [Embleya hyalina]GCE02475.1 two-component sensor histidine kinase [Embleya hyalina]